MSTFNKDENIVRILKQKYHFSLNCDLIPYENIPDTITEVVSDLKKVISMISKSPNEKVVTACENLKKQVTDIVQFLKEKLELFLEVKLDLKCNQDKLYKDLYSSYEKAHSDKKSRKIIQESVNRFWNDNKKGANFVDIIGNEIKCLKQIATKRQVKIDKFWIDASKQNRLENNNKTTEADIVIAPSSNDEGNCHNQSDSISQSDSFKQSDSVSQSGSNDKENNKYCKPVQEKLKTELSVLSSDVSALKKRHNLDLLDDKGINDLKSKKKRLEVCQKEIRKREDEMYRQRKLRLKKKLLLEKASHPRLQSNPTLNKSLKVRSGRPRMEEEQPYLLNAIIELALQGSAAHERRQDETIRTVKTLTNWFKNYTKITPSIYHEAPLICVRLIKASNDMHKQHADSKFAKTTIDHLNELASVLGPDDVIYLSQDDKAKVPIAASKQGPLLMHMQYRVKLPDHNFVVAGGHKLTPSVYAFCGVKPDGGGDPSAITFSGPTFIAIRSAKHTSSTALSHARDIQKIYSTTDFDKLTKTKSLTYKPVLINIVDGGPDENPRYEKVAKMNVHHFLKYDLDALFVACNAPGRSAFNRVERRMATLSKSIVGIILPYDHYGTHLDNQGRTFDVEKEKKNFSYAGEALAEVWSETVIDGHITYAEYVDLDNSNLNESSILAKDAGWYDRHVFLSHYMLQILKCANENCCKRRRSSLFNFLPSNGLPAPIPIKQTTDGLRLSTVRDIQSYASLFVTLSLSDEAKQTSFRGCQGFTGVTDHVTALLQDCS
ncbi:hypothetical protein Bhyg_13166 [Pseudolycoriella hygida]|uniref:Uncharacterized protein n=1 Tax=Pseudolycoriella hygida TaxID=35572 RepID=A0A9Q0MMU0_9DIPT|nr:hypothetical protein Bhyg_13166 [Pseudolycoriella hygida]